LVTISPEEGAASICMKEEVEEEEEKWTAYTRR
jgi:hypothetical protein